MARLPYSASFYCYLDAAEKETKKAGLEGLFVHDCFIHRPAKGHSSWDSDETNEDYRGEDHSDNQTQVISTEPTALEAWRQRNENGPQSAEQREQDKTQRTQGRNPTPRYVLWHLQDRPPKPDPLTADCQPKRFFYWLALGKEDAAKSYDIGARIEVSYDPDDHVIWIRPCGRPVHDAAYRGDAAEDQDTRDSNRGS